MIKGLIYLFLFRCLEGRLADYEEESSDLGDYSLNGQTDEEYGKFPSHVLTEKETGPMDEIRCTNDDYTYNIKLNVHLQNYAIQAIADAAKPKLGMNLKERDAILSYFGTIANELNADLARLGAQIVIGLKHYKAEDFIDTNSFDTSCEIRDPVMDRLDSTFKQLKDVYQDSMGLRLFVWTCPQLTSSFETMKIMSNLNCGRIMGVLWQGADATRTSIKSTILEAISGVSELYLDGALPVDRVFSNVCRFCSKCVGVEPGVIGWKHPDVVKLIHAIPEEDTHEHGYDH
ncbi:putative spore wall protein 7 [Nosema bombycis CQ1]|jgi:hypothetical protein|uniref:Spore wall protein 7 n=1 Tax=Nosema bombycis (strain CQ1 / CVCC 102059) TaxID=578461 RepID=SWP7_NOSB1|nr:RecName: Full=Spore wall protein 7; Flags: Precursor [Nosema bombycis CQ1]EOB13707.1 putative spore wall protein 7 [Nosema bombycis CQ1]|eukprot:EOB13707.1 putative spore wall protein 7 [Nosema bombycis CQ1]